MQARREGSPPKLLASIVVAGLTAVAIAELPGCAEPARGGRPSGMTGGGAGDGAGGAGGGSGSGFFDGGLEGDGGPPPPPPVLYAHDRTAMYKAEPAATPISLSLVGAFDCVGGSGEDGSMTDLAVSSTGEIWGISVDHVYRLEVQGSVVHCAQTIALNNPNNTSFYALTFAPRGVLHPDEEVLVAGNTAGELWSIDTSGNLARRGTFGLVPPNDGHGHTYANAGKAWELSGDIAFAENNGSPVGFATVRDCPDPPSASGCNLVDTLIEIDVEAMATATTGSVTRSVRGQVVKRAGCNDGVVGNYGSMYGIAIYEERVIGFSRFPQDMPGFVVDMSNVDGTACLLQASPATAWYGAGITTLVPVKPPR